MVTATPARESADVRAAGLSQTALVFRVRAATLAVDAERATSRQECALATMVPQAAIVQAKLVQRTAAVTDTAIPARAPVAVWVAALATTARAPSIVGRMALVNQANARARLVSLATTAPR